MRQQAWVDYSLVGLVVLFTFALALAQNPWPADVQIADLTDDFRTDTEAACVSDPMPPGTPPCPPQCTGGCSNGTCTIDCTGAGQCEFQTLDCPPDYACSVKCDGEASCDSGTINCPTLYACDLQCTGGEDACADVQLVCGSGSCSIDCDPPNSSCAGSIVDCGAGMCSAHWVGTPPQLNCGSSCQCTCTNPSSGDWIVASDCTLEQNVAPPADVIVNENITMTVAGGITLDIDLNTFSLEVKNGAKIVIKNGAKVE